MSSKVVPEETLERRVTLPSRTFPAIWHLVRTRKWLFLFGLTMVMVNRLAGLALPYLSRPFVDDVMIKHDRAHLIPIVIAVFCATAVQAITSFVNTQIASKAALEMVADLRRRVQQHIGVLPLAFHDQNRVGGLVSRIMNDVEGIKNLVGTGSVEFLGGLCTATVAFIFLISHFPLMATMTFAVITVFVLILKRAFEKIRPILRDRSIITSEVSGRLTESLAGIRVIKGYHAENEEANVFSHGVSRLLSKSTELLTATNLLSIISASALGIIGGLVMLLSGQLSIAHKMSPGDYIQFTMFLAYLVSPLSQMVNTGTQLSGALAGIDRTIEILQERSEFRDISRSTALREVTGQVKFQNVWFAYTPGDWVLRDMTFTVEPGTITALVGPSGSGKTTIISLLCAFYTVQKGLACVDGCELSTVDLNSYRSQLGVVLQESFLFEGTIRENILLSRPHATDEEFREACRVAHVDEFAVRLPRGYETIVGERGLKLSGGQRQRVSIARAIVANPRILILDEATSSLDSESEAMIQDGILHLMQARTTFVIAHRLSTIRRADQIFVVENGQIVERGEHVELYAFGGRYWDLYTKQYAIESNYR